MRKQTVLGFFRAKLFLTEPLTKILQYPDAFYAHDTYASHFYDYAYPSYDTYASHDAYASPFNTPYAYPSYAHYAYGQNFSMDKDPMQSHSEFCSFISADTMNRDLNAQVHGGQQQIPSMQPMDTSMQSMDTPMDNVWTAYKPVARKVKPVPGVFPEDARVERKIPEDPLLTLPPLPIHPPNFIPTSKLTQENLESLCINHEGFLWPEEEKLIIHVIKLNERAIAFDDMERGTLREDYFSPYIIPTIPHIPWEFKNIPIPPGVRAEIMQLLKDKIAAGVYEPSQASYRSPWFWVKKKNTGSLRIVHDLQPLNAVTIRDAEVPPILDDFVEPFSRRQCCTVFDLYWGFDARKLHPKSRDLTTFLTPLGLLRITSLPMGYTNAPAEFQRCMTFILQDEIPDYTNVFIDDVPIRGPESQYLDENGEPETIPGNPGIRRFIWEHTNDVHRILHRVGCAGATFSYKKTQICRPEVVILGQKCTPEGRLPADEKITKILDWPRPRTVKDVRSFLGLCGVVRIWIHNYSMIIRPLTELWRKNTTFEWTEARENAFQSLKKIITSPPALRPIDYNSSNPVILAVDSSYLGVGMILSQMDEHGKKHPSRFGSIPFNEREANYGQPKLELYGLFRALRAFRRYLVGVKSLQVEVDAKYIKGMLKRPDLQPNATMNRWVQGILLYDFSLVHVPATEFKGPDALSRRQATQQEIEECQEDDEWLDEIALCTMTPGFPQLTQLGYTQLTLPSFLVDNTKADQSLHDIKAFLENDIVPHFASDTAKKRFSQKVQQFFVKNGNLYKRRKDHAPLRVILTAAGRLEILTQAHEGLAHRGIHGVFQTIRERFYWPRMHQDVEHHVKSCHECQIRSVKKVEVPITISTPATIFSKVYVDVMLMPKAKGYRYIVAARDDLSLAAEGRALRKASAANLAKFFWEELICRYGAIGEVVTDNGPEVKGAFEELMRRYGIPQIKISAYNSKANGVVERGHFIIREGIIKSCNGNVNQWPTKVHHAFFADKCITRRSTGFSPFYLLHGVDPVLPFDLTEATFLVHGFHSGMSTDELLALRIRQLEKHPEDIAQAAATIQQSRLQSKEQFEELFKRRITTHIFKPGDLVLVRNSQVEKELDKKSKPRYIGPYQIVRQTQGGSYVLQELDGAISRRGVAHFRLLPYIAREGQEIAKTILEEEEQQMDDLEHDTDDNDPEEDEEENDDY